MTTIPFDNHLLTKRRLQFIGMSVNKLTLKSINIIQSSNNYNIVSSFICWNLRRFVYLSHRPHAIENDRLLNHENPHISVAFDYVYSRILCKHHPGYHRQTKYVESSSIGLKT